jgi:elongation factor P
VEDLHGVVYISDGTTKSLRGIIFAPFFTEFLHVKPGKGNAFVRTKLKSMTTGKVVEHTFPSGHKIDDVRVERRKFQYLYNDETGYNFMDNETYDQVVLNGNMLERPDFLKEGSDIEILFHAEKNVPLTAEMPASIILEVTYTEPGVRGDTATNVTKPATVETGAEVKVPIFINEGDRIKIDTRTGAYLERVKA